MFSRHSIYRSLAGIVLTGGVLAGTVAGAGAAQAAAPAGWPAAATGYVAAGHAEYASWGNGDSGYGYWPSSVAGQVVAPVVLNIRSGPGTSYPVVGQLGNSNVISISCKTDGSDVYGNYRWFRLADGSGWVSAHYVNNFGYVPWCGN